MAKKRIYPILPLSELKKDKRVKLSPEQKEEIRSIQGKVTQVAAARFYNVSPTTIRQIWFPYLKEQARICSIIAHEKYGNTERYKKIAGRKVAKYAQKKKAEKEGLL